MGRKIIDLTGQRFGRLVVLGRAENKGKDTMWHCRCDCGNEKDIRGASLQAGLTKSCGCLSKETTSKVRFKDISGRKIGMIEVLSRVPSVKNESKKRTYYKCRCSCGNVFVTERERILNGNTKSCGCYKSEQSHKRFFKDISGQRFGKLKVIEFYGNSERGNAMWKCQCDCGNVVICNGGNLRNGNTKSCGCITRNKTIERSTKHGKSGSQLYRVYNHMKGRCYTETDSAYKDYGGRGIKICDEWLGERGFENFYNWSMENGFRVGLTIDRINNDGNYEPSNCRWTDKINQCNNRRSNRFLTARGETHTVAEWSRITGLKSATIIQRLNRGDDGEVALREVRK